MWQIVAEICHLIVLMCYSDIPAPRFPQEREKGRERERERGEGGFGGEVALIDPMYNVLENYI